MPRQVNPTQPNRTATAPYNFIPLPEEVLSAEACLTAGGESLRPWEHHDEFVPETSSGWIDLEITTRTPLYIRGPLYARDNGWDRRENRVRPEPFSTMDGLPIIPGSTLRGAIRTLVEILAFAKIRPVSRSKPFFRTVANDRIGLAYRNRLMRRGTKPKGGFIQFSASGAVFISPCDVLRVDRDKLGNHVASRPDEPPPWPRQYSDCWVRMEGGHESVRHITFQEPSSANGQQWRRGTLVLSGYVPGKKREFVFLESASESLAINIPKSTWDRFHDSDQISQWQEKAFPKNQPQRGDRRKKAGFLRNGEPVFFLTDDSQKCEANPDGLVFLGRAQMFRFPYDLTPDDLVPENLRQAPLDFAEAMFGCVRQGKTSKGTTIKGRVFFEDAVACAGGPPWTEDILVPRILSSPKPTSFQHYLTQNGTRTVQELTTYLKGDNTVIRGHKLYWHRWDENQKLADVRETSGHDEKLRDLIEGREDSHKQHTIIQPVREGVKFKSRVRFENLTDVEIGALLTALDLPPNCLHKIGMGKPLGLGSVRVSAALHLVDLDARYGDWQRDGVRVDSGRQFRDAFEKTILDHARSSGETLNAEGNGLSKIGRFDALYSMLEWQNRPGRQKTESMPLANFRERRVLPTPHRVAGRTEPAWPSDPPRPGQLESSQTERPARGTVPPRSVAVSQAPPEPPQSVKRIEKGQTLVGTIVHKDGRWNARFDGDDRDAVILNMEEMSGPTEGIRAEFYVFEQSKKGGIKVRFVRKMP